MNIRRWCLSKSCLYGDSFIAVVSVSSSRILTVLRYRKCDIITQISHLLQKGYGSYQLQGEQVFVICM
ncbi:hypothetical protein REPUB_Repub06bG0142500 [Reevesia pubescens]